METLGNSNLRPGVQGGLQNSLKVRLIPGNECQAVNLGGGGEERVHGLNRPACGLATRNDPAAGIRNGYPWAMVSGFTRENIHPAISTCVAIRYFFWNVSEASRRGLSKNRSRLKPSPVPSTPRFDGIRKVAKYPKRQRHVPLRICLRPVIVGSTCQRQRLFIKLHRADMVPPLGSCQAEVHHRIGLSTAVTDLLSNFQPLLETGIRVISFAQFAVRSAQIVQCPSFPVSVSYFAADFQLLLMVFDCELDLTQASIRSARGGVSEARAGILRLPCRPRTA